jgi:hypothetical protein
MAKISKAVVATTDTTFATKIETRSGDIMDENQSVRRMERGHTLPFDEVANTPLSIFASINNLREIARRCLANEPIDRYLGLWLGSALHGYLSHQHQTIEQAFNLRFPKGGVPWWREEAIRIRNASLRDLASRFLRGCNPCQQAQQILTMSTRYAASAWRNDREGPEMPKHYAGTAKEYLWSAFKSGAPMPIGERQLRNVLAD